MTDNYIRLGARSFIDEFERFFHDIICKFSFSSFFEAHQSSFYENMTLFVFAKGYPALYVLVRKTGPFLVGFSPERGGSNCFSKQFSVSVPSDIALFYRTFFLKIGAIPPETKDIRMFISMQKKASSISSFAAFGKRAETVKILKEENILGIKKLAVSSLFTDEKIKYVLNSYERWSEKNYRLDFNNEKVLFSLKIKKESNNTESENRAVASMVKTVISDSYSNIFEPLTETDSLKGIPMILTTFQINFSVLPKWINMIELFLERFDNALNEIDRVLDEIVFPQMKFLK
ncbi:MAG TPA: hypothetical protein PLB99_01590 [Thermotogota bacterium]|nr:hypothetical protein [Thermotogota bacterium]